MQCSCLSHAFLNEWLILKGALLHILDRSEELHQAYCDEMRHSVADILVFLDESVFNKTGWRHQAYAPIGSKARYEAEKDVI